MPARSWSPKVKHQLSTGTCSLQTLATTRQTLACCLGPSLPASTNENGLSRRQRSVNGRQQAAVPS